MTCDRLPGLLPPSMGEYEAAWARDSEAAYWLEEPSPPWLDLHDEEIWITADGTEIPYSDLTHGHLKAIIRMRRRQLREAYGGPWPNGEQAGYALEDAINQADAELEALEAEQQRRRDEAFP